MSALMVALVDQEYKRIVIIVIVFQFFMLFGLLPYTRLYYTRSIAYVKPQSAYTFLVRTPYVQYYTVLYLMYHHVMSSFFTKLLINK